MQWLFCREDCPSALRTGAALPPLDCSRACSSGILPCSWRSSAGVAVDASLSGA